MFSIKLESQTASNALIMGTLKGIVGEEMVHLCLASNLLISIGG